MAQPAPVAKPIAKEADRISFNTYGLLGGRGSLSSSGSSVQELAQNLKGHIGIAMKNGHISDVLTYLMELDAGKAISRYVEGDKGQPIDCMICSFQIERGVAKAETILLVTPTTNIQGQGVVDLGRERLDLTLTSHPKTLSLDSLRTPLMIEGPLASPKVRPKGAGLAAKIEAALALGAAAGPAAALLPFVEAGVGKKGVCATHIRELLALQPQPGEVKQPADGKAVAPSH